MSWNFVLTAVTALTLLQQSEAYLKLTIAPVTPPRSKFMELGLAVFDVDVDSKGRVVNETVLTGNPRFIEPSRLSLRDWSFTGVPDSPTHVNAVFLYKPKLTLPDLPSTFNLPVPESSEQSRSPYPTRIVEPGYPVDGINGGAVVVQVRIDNEGVPRQVGVVTESPGLTDVTVLAVRDWRFSVPPDTGPGSRTAIVSIHFATPQTADVGPTPEIWVENATIVRGSVPGMPPGTRGALSTNDPSELAFTSVRSHWALPYSLVTGLEYAETRSGQNLLTVAFLGDRNEVQTVTFRVEQQSPLATVSAISARTGLSIDFR